MVSDCDNNRVMMFENVNEMINGQQASFVLGQPNPSAGNQPNQGMENPSPNTLHHPTSAVFDSFHNMIWVVDQDNDRVLGFK